MRIYTWWGPKGWFGVAPQPWELVTYQFGFLVRGPKADQIPEAELEKLQAAHLAYMDEALVEALEAQPGVRAVGLTHRLPLSALNDTATFEFEGYTPPPGQGNAGGEYRLVGGDYFRAMGIRLVRGRPFDERDDAGAPAVAIVDEEAARQRFAARLLAGLAVTGLLLAGIGIYGLLAFVVARDARQIGIRMALGATAKDVRRLVVGRGLASVALGLGVGLAAAAAFSRVIASQL